eukprot:scaffold11260_cov105-Isochrysis_galbana.AAC.4
MYHTQNRRDAQHKPRRHGLSMRALACFPALLPLYAPPIEPRASRPLGSSAVPCMMVLMGPGGRSSSSGGDVVALPLAVLLCVHPECRVVTWLVGGGGARVWLNTTRARLDASGGAAVCVHPECRVVTWLVGGGGARVWLNPTRARCASASCVGADCAAGCAPRPFAPYSPSPSSLLR